jgi:hypothetical protein
MDDKFNIKFGKRGEHLGAFGYCSWEGMDERYPARRGPFERGNLSSDICGGGIVDSGVVELSTGGFWPPEEWSKSTMEVWYNSSTEPFTNMNSDDYSETCSLDGSPCLDINGETWNGDETLCPPECVYELTEPHVNGEDHEHPHTTHTRCVLNECVVPTTPVTGYDLNTLTESSCVLDTLTPTCNGIMCEEGYYGTPSVSCDRHEQELT